MHLAPPLERIDYLLIGHFSKDLLPDGSFQLGGTVAYGALTARALGLRVGVVSSFNEKDISLAPLHGIPVLMQPSEATTTFSNLETPRGRRQILHHRADNIDFSQIPSVWRRAAIIHLAPIIQEVEGQLPDVFSPALLA